MDGKGIGDGEARERVSRCQRNGSCRPRLELIEADGLEAFSTRKLAAKLGCEAMSIYHYFPSKAHLMDALLDRLVGDHRRAGARRCPGGSG